VWVLGVCAGLRRSHARGHPRVSLLWPIGGPA
jgi:hypothetical protein